MYERSFADSASLDDATEAILLDIFTQDSEYPFGVMLSGGKTPVEIYNWIAKSGTRAARRLHVLFSDERMVPADSPDNNYANAVPMIAALGMPDERVIRVRTELPIDRAAAKYHEDLQAFFDKGGHITLGLLGLGADGHTASLFSLEQIRSAGDRWAMPVTGKGGFDRVSVTPKFLSRVERIVFLVAGIEKASIVKRLREKPEEVPAAKAVEDAASVEVWECV